MTSRIANGRPRTTWRILAAMVAAVAIVSLVHWHPLFGDSGSETLRDAASQCAACATGSSVTPPPVAVLLALVPIARALSTDLALSAPPAARGAISPRAPPL